MAFNSQIGSKKLFGPVKTGQWYDLQRNRKLKQQDTIFTVPSYARAYKERKERIIC